MWIAFAQMNVLFKGKWKGYKGKAKGKGNHNAGNKEG